jgi:hypothetical protein
MNARRTIYTLILACALCASTQTQAAEQAAAPLFSDIGNHNAPITTAAEKAQQYFNQGLMLTYGFNHAEAVRSFRAAQAADPACAMCFWGEAYALGPNINKPMADSDVAAAFSAASKAAGLAASATTREQAYIHALQARYQATAVADRKPLDQAFADAMAEVVAHYPDDLDAAALYAESLMNVMPWNYYTSDGKSKPMTDVVIATLESILARNPAHAGAIHFYIHAVEASDQPGRAEAGADRLADLAPGLGHLVHMPSHIYLRIGRYHDATKANELASLADESYINQCRAQGFYPALYYPHNIHFLWYTASLEGRSKIAIEAAHKLAENVPRNLIGDIPLLEQFLAVPMFGLVRFARWDEILEQEQPPANYHFATAMWHAARGIALSAKSRADEAQQERAGFAENSAHFGDDAFQKFGYPANTLLGIAEHLLDAALAGSTDARVAKLEAAVTAEDSLPYMEPPYWFFPVRQVLGAALLGLGRAADAEKVYRLDLEKVPDNGWSLQGLAASLAAQSRDDEKTEVVGLLAKAWSRADIGTGPAARLKYF